MILDSFAIDHTKMTAPAVRLVKIMKTPNGDSISIFDIRFCKPNIEDMSERGIHTLEHLLAVLMRKYLDNEIIKIIDISPMGCRTGFYMSLIGKLDELSVIVAWKQAMNDIVLFSDQKEIYGLNKYQCGNYRLHSLEEAKSISKRILNQKIRINSNRNLIRK